MDVLTDLNYVNNSGSFNVNIPAQLTGLNNTISGELELSRSGYVYSAPSKSVVWLKFLALGFFLPLNALASKCTELVKNLLGCSVPKKGLHDLKHSFHLANIAWKAVVGEKKVALMDRVEEFALAELDYNNRNHLSELSLPRSQRLVKGIYTAPCMQPLFHRDQYSPTDPLKVKIGKINRQIQEIEKRLDKLVQIDDEPVENSCWKYLNFFYAEQDPQILEERLEDELNKLYANKDVLEKQLAVAEKCQKYAIHAIVNQQCCLDLVDHSTETLAEVRCCNKICFREQRICGLLHRVECCAIRCWAMNCICCACCFSPDLSCCLIT